MAIARWRTPGWARLRFEGTTGSKGGRAGALRPGVTRAMKSRYSIFSLIRNALSEKRGSSSKAIL